jgi:hypothetical protein
MNEVIQFHERSHIIPEWMYTSCYDEKHKLLEVSRVSQKIVKKQKGLYSSFMCSECENETQKYDHYASLILTERSSNSDQYKSIKREYFSKYYRSEKIDYWKWEKIDFKKFQQFIFSVVLRTYFAGALNGIISLNGKHLDGLLAIYRDKSICDDFSYPTLVTKYQEEDKLREHIMIPFIDKNAGHHIIKFGAAGYLFQIYISSHSKLRFVESLKLRTDGSLFIISQSLREMGLYKNILKVINITKNTSTFSKFGAANTTKVKQ